MSFLPTTNRSGILAGIYLVNAVVAPLTIFYNVSFHGLAASDAVLLLTQPPQWTAANFGGATKRAFATAIISGSFSLGNIIGPQTFQARDAPQFRPAKLAVMGTQAGCALTTFLLFLYYVWENKRRGARLETEESFMEPEVWATLTDRENKRFRYTY